MQRSLSWVTLAGLQHYMRMSHAAASKSEVKLKRPYPSSSRMLEATVVHCSVYFGRMRVGCVECAMFVLGMGCGEFVANGVFWSNFDEAAVPYIPNSCMRTQSADLVCKMPCVR